VVAWRGTAAAEAVVGRGRPTTRLRRDARHQPVSVKELALGLSKRAWRRIEWREGSAEPLASRFARLRIRVAHRDALICDRKSGC
jgi:SRSO17 transposase